MVMFLTLNSEACYEKLMVALREAGRFLPTNQAAAVLHFGWLGLFAKTACHAAIY